MQMAEELVRKLGRKAPQYVVDQIQAAIRRGDPDPELQALEQQLDEVQKLLQQKS